MALTTVPRWDKYDPYVGNHRAPLAVDLVLLTQANRVMATGKNSNGAVVIGAGQTGVNGLVIVDVGKDINGDLLSGGINVQAGDILDVGVHGEITSFAPWAVGVADASQPAPVAGKNYYGHPDGSVINATGPGAVYVGHTVEKDRLIVHVQCDAPTRAIQDNVPVGLAATGASVSANLSWTAVKNATAYKLYSSTDNTTFTAATPASVAAPNTTATLTGLTAGVRYFKVLATVGGVDSAQSASVSATVT
jgi:hypothetical protein